MIGDRGIVITELLRRAHKFSPRRCFLLAAVLLLQAAAARAQAPNEKIVFSIPSRSIQWNEGS